MRKTIISIGAIAALAFPVTVSAHDTICGGNAGQRKACHVSYVKARISERYDIRSAHNHTAEVSVAASRVLCGAHSFCGSFTASYNPPGIGRVVHCAGRVRIHAHTGQIIRIRDLQGHVLTDRTAC